MVLGRRQLLFLTWMVRQESDGGSFHTPWGPVEDERVRKSLVRRGALTVRQVATSCGYMPEYTLTQAGRGAGQTEWERIRRDEWPGSDVYFPWEG